MIAALWRNAYGLGSATTFMIGTVLVGWASVTNDSLAPVVVAPIGLALAFGLLILALRERAPVGMILFLIVNAAYVGVGGMISVIHGAAPTSYPVEFQIATGANAMMAAGVSGVVIAAGMQSRQVSYRRGLATPPWWLLAAATLPLALAGVVFFVRAGSIPLFATDEDARMAAVAGNTYARTVYQAIAVPSMYAVLRLLHGAQRRWSAAGLAVLTVIALLLTGFRADAGWYVVTLLVVLWMVGMRPPWTAVLASALALGLLFAAVALVRSGGEFRGPSQLAMNILGVHVSNEVIVFRFFPDHHPFVWGLTYMKNLFTLLPGAQLDVTLWLKEVMGFEFSGGGVTPTLAGEAYINFGYLGLLLVPLVIGVAIATVERLPRRDAGQVLVFAIIAAGIAHSIPGGLGNVLINTAWLAVVALAIRSIAGRWSSAC